MGEEEIEGGERERKRLGREEVRERRRRLGREEVRERRRRLGRERRR